MVWVECLISCRGYCQHEPQCPTSCPSCPHRHAACALLFFSSSMPRSLLSVTVFTLCESISTATDSQSLQCTARRLSVCSCSTSDSAFSNTVVLFSPTGRLSSPSGTACILLLYHIPLMKTSSKFYCLTSREPFRFLFCMLHLLCYAVMVIFQHPLLHLFNFTIYLLNLFLDCLYQRTVNYLCYSITCFFYIMT